MSLVNCCKRCDGGHNGNRNDRPKCHGNCYEQQESSYLISCGMRETAVPVHHECRKLIYNFNHDDYPSPQP